MSVNTESRLAYLAKNEKDWLSYNVASLDEIPAQQLSYNEDATHLADAEAFEQESFTHEQLAEMSELYMGQYPKLVGRARKFSVSDPEGLVQVAFEKALKNWDKFSDPGDGRGRGPWLSTILTNTALDELRRAKVHQGKDYLISEFYDHKETSVDIRAGAQFGNVETAPYALHKYVKNLLEQLGKPSSWARIFFLHTEGYSYGEIGDILDVPVGTIQSAMFRMKKVLAKDEQLRAAFGEFEAEIEKVL